jgi:hypothetical protein
LRSGVREHFGFMHFARRGRPCMAPCKAPGGGPRRAASSEVSALAANDGAFIHFFAAAGWGKNGTAN